MILTELEEPLDTTDQEASDSRPVRLVPETSFDETVRLAQALTDDGRFAEAEERWREAVAIGEKTQAGGLWKALCGLAAALTERKDYAEATERIRSALKVEAEDEQCYICVNRLAGALAEDDRLMEAQELWSEAVAIGEKAQAKGRWVALCGWARALAVQKQYAKSAAKVREALEIDPNDERRYRCVNGLALALVEDARFEEAEARWREALAIAENAHAKERRIVLCAWAEALSNRGDHVEAAGKVRQALDLEPHDRRSYESVNVIAKALAHAGRFEDAAKVWREAVAVAEKAHAKERWISLCAWAEALVERKKYVEAATRVHEALEIEPSAEQCYNCVNDLAHALAESARFKEADDLWREAVEIGERAAAKKRWISLCAWAEALVERKEYGEAATRIHEALAIEPNVEQCYNCVNDLAYALAESARFKEADDLWREAVEIGERAVAKERWIALRAWGARLAETSRLDEALTRYLQALALNHDETYLHACFSDLAQAFAQARRFDEITSVFDKAWEILKASQSSNVEVTLANWGDTLRWLGYPDAARQRYNDGLRINPENKNLVYGLGLVLAEEGKFQEAVKYYMKASENGQAWPLAHWAIALQELERFEQGAAIAKRAVAVEPGEVWHYITYSNILLSSYRFDEASRVLGEAIRLHRDSAFPHHNLAHLLFLQGRYKEGWQRWRIARDSYEQHIAKASGPEKAEQATYLGGVLTEVFGEYEMAEKYYLIAVDLKSFEPSTWKGLVSTYQKWANASNPPQDIQNRLSRALQEAILLSKRQLGNDNDFPVLLALADLYIETGDLVEAQGCITQAGDLCQDSRLRRAEVNTRQGLLDFRGERYLDAVESLRKAVAVRPSDLELRTNFGNALLRAKRLVEARQEFSKVLKAAPGQIDALMGDAQVCIELAGAGEAEYYKEAEQRLSEALRYGYQDGNSGSTQLRGSRLDEAHYLRGYTRAKQWEAKGGAAASLTLLLALRDFMRCQQHAQAPTSAEKIRKYLSQRVSDATRTKLGAAIMFCAATIVFVLVQLDFFFRGNTTLQILGSRKGIEEPLTYGTLTFGALLFMIASLYLPHLLKFKVAGIELEKAATNQVSAPTSLGISLPASTNL